jgi:hypothetical protein
MNRFSKVRATLTLALFLVPLFVCKVASADSVNIMVGDKDGFGYGLGTCPNTGTCSQLSSPIIDNRSAAEASATNGAQYTDVYSSFFSSPYGPNPTETGDIIFDFTGTLTDGTITFAAGDFQSDVFGAFAANINGVSIPFSYADGRDVDAVHSITLTSAEIAAANLVGYVDLHLDRNGSGDFVAFDYFDLTGDTTTSATPEPSTLALFSTGVLGLAATIRRKFLRA